MTLWLVPLLPFLAGIVNALLPLEKKRTAFALAVGSMGCSLALSLSLFATVLRTGGARDVFNFTWLAAGGAPLELGFLLDPLTALMVTMVTFVSLLIFIYSHGYMKDDRAYARFFSFLAMFAGGMLGLCVANSLLLLFVSWEIVGLCSYLLIGFWYEKKSAAAAAKKAFLVTKLGDLGFFIGMLWLYASTGTQLLYADGAGILEQEALAGLASVGGVWLGMNLAGVLALLLFCGAVGKSGQFPLHVWLPDAMEGPTPVSALIHAATMVAAGVFLVGRVYPLFEVEPMALDVVTWVGAFTALFAASIAVAQNDIKRILAYSTVSQLGFMMLGLGAVGFAAGIFHLITHAFFKALLFLGSGSVIHACNGEQDIMKMGGLRGSMKITFTTYVIGAAALAGVFPLAGFWSKDEILHGTFEAGRMVPFAMAMTASFLTAFYMTRQVALVFFGAARSAGHADEGGHGDGSPHAGAHAPHESPAVMTAPLVVLSLFAVGLGFFGTPWANVFHHFLEPSAQASAANVGFMLVATLFPLAGIAGGWLLYGARPLALAGGQPVDPLARVQPLWGLLERRWMIDELYAATVVRLVNLAGGAFAALDYVIDRLTLGVATLASMLSRFNRAVDDRGVRPFVQVIGSTIRGTGFGLSRLQTGRVHDYLSAITLGAVVIVAVYLLMAFVK
jgi:NADH-quinone oxidoreductase subunit L